jgi:hypothetical protein
MVYVLCHIVIYDIYEQNLFFKATLVFSLCAQIPTYYRGKKLMSMTKSAKSSLRDEVLKYEHQFESLRLSGQVSAELVVVLNGLSV